MAEKVENRAIAFEEKMMATLKQTIPKTRWQRGRSVLVNVLKAQYPLLPPANGKKGLLQSSCTSGKQNMQVFYRAFKDHIL